MTLATVFSVGAHEPVDMEYHNTWGILLNCRIPQITKGKSAWVFTVILNALGHFKGIMGELSDMTLGFLCKICVSLRRFG